jgi:hypothetical protein
MRSAQPADSGALLLRNDKIQVWGFKTRCSAAERSMRTRRKGDKLSESREKRDEFLTTPRLCASRGEPQAKLLGAFSLKRAKKVSTNSF